MLSGGTAHGYEATLLADICDYVLDARSDGRLNEARQGHIAAQCELLVRGFARTGIIALVDEATGYQYLRPRRALVEILEKYISERLVGWAKRFPDEFYTEMFRLKGWNYLALKPGANKPSVVGRYTRDIVYQRLAPGVVEELERLNPTVAPGRRKVKHHQYLTEDIGHAELREHLAKVHHCDATVKRLARLPSEAAPRLAEAMGSTGVCRPVSRVRRVGCRRTRVVARLKRRPQQRSRPCAHVLHPPDPILPRGCGIRRQGIGILRHRCRLADHARGGFVGVFGPAAHALSLTAGAGHRPRWADSK